MKLIGSKDRDAVHHDGSWHRGVQLNIWHEGKLLMQQRSSAVDIAKNLFDQSLATQMCVEDREDERRAIYRGLREELGVVIHGFKKIAGPVKIEKRYDYDPTLWNREFVSLFEVKIDGHTKNKLRVASPKVKKIKWASIDSVRASVNKNPEGFTKTFAMWLRGAM